MQYGDSATEVGGGSTSITLSRNAVETLDPELRTTKAAQRAAKSAVIVNGNAGITITTLDKAGSEKHYRSGNRKDGHPHRPQKQRRPHRHRDHDLKK